MYHFKPVVYKSVEEKRAAFLKAVNARNVWEAQQRELIAQQKAKTTPSC